MEDVYVVHANLTGEGKPIGVYKHLDRARKEADVHAAAVFGEATQTLSTQTPDGTEMRVHLFKGERIGSHAIYHFTLDEEGDNSESPEPQFNPTRQRISLDEDV
jgi:hypothetical protein